MGSNELSRNRDELLGEGVNLDWLASHPGGSGVATLLASSCGYKPFKGVWRPSPFDSTNENLIDAEFSASNASPTSISFISSKHTYGWERRNVNSCTSIWDRRMQRNMNRWRCLKRFTVMSSSSHLARKKKPTSPNFLTTCKQTKMAYF